jgi:putative ABC transport system permease protein
MSFWAAMRTALRALVKNKLRSFLATLGVVIAVAAVVATVALGQGASAKVAQQMESLGTNLLYVSAGSAQNRGVSGGAGTGKPLSLDDGAAIERELPQLVAAVAPVTRTGGQVVYRDANWSTLLVGTTAAYLEVRQWPISSGTFFGHDEDAAAAKVCVLGKTVADKLFAGVPALGEQIRVKHLTCRVIGVLASKGQGGWGQDQDDVVLMPWTTLTHRLIASPNNQGLTFVVSARSPDIAAELQAQIVSLMRQRHRLAEGADDDFLVFNVSEMQEAAKEQTRTLSLLLGSVALISLIVGAIGIANVMLVSVTERTREIGVRMAIGARGRDILLQFLTEALVLASVGGAIGLCLGSALAGYMAAKGDWPVLLSPWVMLLTLALAAVAGIVAGFYPALRASRLDPIEALRYE